MKEIIWAANKKQVIYKSESMKETENENNNLINFYREKSAGNSDNDLLEIAKEKGFGLSSLSSFLYILSPYANIPLRKVLSSYSSILLPDPFDISVDQKENNRGSDRPFTKFSANFERMREEVSLSEEEVNNLYQIISNISSQIEKQNFMEKLDYHWHLGYIDLRSDIMNPTNNNNINEDSNNPINIYNIAKTLRVVSSFFGEIKNQSLEPYLQIVQNIKANPTSNYKFVINMASIYYFPGYFRFSSVIHKRKAKNLIDGVWKCYNKKWVVKYKATSDKSRSQHVKIQSLTIENWDYLLTVDKWKYSLKLREWSKSIPENELFCYPVFLSQDNDILAVPSLGIVRTDEYSFYCMYYPYHLFFSI